MWDYDVLKELKAKMDGDSIEAKIATELHDITEQFNEGILTAEEYKELLLDIEKINKANELAEDEVTSRWLTNTVKLLISVV
jgi:hypothetical protein